MLEGLVNSDGIDVLERTMQFAHHRHRLIVNNIANLSTPNFRPTDVDPNEFRQALRKAVETRRAGGGSAANRPLPVKNTKHIKFDSNDMTLDDTPAGHNILFHDRNDRDIERIMQDLAENTLAHRTASELLRSKFAMLQTAIRERV